MDVDRIHAYLLERHLLTPEDVVSSGVTIEDRTRRNRNFVVLPATGDGFLLKQPMSPKDPKIALFASVEADLLRTLAFDETLAPVRRYAPPLVYHDRANAVLVTELIHPATSLTKYHLNLGQIQFDAAAARSSAELLADFHRAGASALRAGRLAFLPDHGTIALTLSSFLDTQAAQGEAAAILYRSALAKEAPELAGAPSLDESWRSRRSLVHGDVRWDNFLVCEGPGPRGNLNLRLIDWELTCCGDPLYDVACWLSEYIRFWLTIGTYQRLRAPEFATKVKFPLTACHGSARAFWEAYAARAGIAPSAREEAFLRVLSYLPHVVLLIGFEFAASHMNAGTNSELPVAAQVPLEMARRARERPWEVSAEWFGLAKEVIASDA